MNTINKIGLGLFMIGLHFFPPSNDWRGALLMLVLFAGLGMFVYEGSPTQRAADGVPPQEPGDITPADVHEKMWRLRQPRRR